MLGKSWVILVVYATLSLIGGASRAEDHALAPTAPGKTPIAAPPTEKPPAHAIEKLSPVDQRFLEQASGADLAQVKLGHLALERGSTTAVKQYARKMIDDHTRLSDQLAQVAARQGVTVPIELPHDARALYESLSRLTGEAFDRAYLDAMMNSHAEVIGSFQAEAENGSNPGLKDFATDALPSLKQHSNLAHHDSQQMHHM